MFYIYIHTYLQEMQLQQKYMRNNFSTETNVVILNENETIE